MNFARYSLNLLFINKNDMKKLNDWMFAIILTSGIAMMISSCSGNNTKEEKTATEPTADTVAVTQPRDTFPSDRWMMENKKKEGVIESEGIQYRIIKEGTGRIPNKRMRVKMNFELRLTNGKVVESHKGKDVMELPISRLIPGLQNALKQMPEGSIWEVYVPWDLGYGAEGSKNIPPHSALIFNVHLIEIVM